MKRVLRFAAQNSVTQKHRLRTEWGFTGVKKVLRWSRRYGRSARPYKFARDLDMTLTLLTGGMAPLDLVPAADSLAASLVYCEGGYTPPVYPSCSDDPCRP